MTLMELLKTRRSYRRFRQQPVSQEVVKELLLAATYASSAANLQPLSYIVVNSQENVGRVFECTRWAAYLPREQGYPKENERPAMFICVVQNRNISAKCDVDVGLAISNMTLAAWNRGVGSCILGAFDKGKLSEMLKLSETQVLHTVVAFGYPAHESLLTQVKDGNVRYALNENGDYVVPKRRIEDIIRYV